MGKDQVSFTSISASQRKVNKEICRIQTIHSAMKLPVGSKKKRHYKSEDGTIPALLPDNPGLRSPKASPRRTPKKRKNKGHYNKAPSAPACKRILDLTTFLPVEEQVPDNSEDSCQKTDETGKLPNQAESSSQDYAEKEGNTLLQSINEEEEEAEEEDSTEKEIAIVKVIETVKTPAAENEAKKSDDIDEGYFDLSYVDQENTTGPAPDEDKQSVHSVDACTSTSTPEPPTELSPVDNLNSDLAKLTIAVSSQTESEPKRCKVSKACQITDNAVVTLNKKLLNLRNKMNRKMVECEEAEAKSTEIKRKCSDLEVERLSLLAQAEALQHECVKKMHSNEKLSLKVDQKECHISTLKETLLLRDKEIHLLHRQPSSAAVAQQLTDYRELEMLRVDNIRLLHDNRALTASLDSLNGQLCALRRISKTYDECSDSVILMNKRLAEDNSVLTCTLNNTKRELRTLTQEQSESREELRYLRSSCKRTAAQRDELEKRSSSAGDTLAEDNRELVKQNQELKQAIVSLKEEVGSLHSELSNTRNTYLAFERTLQEKSDLQKHLVDIEESNSELWARVAKLRADSNDQKDALNNQSIENKIIASENEELRKTNDALDAKNKDLQNSLNEEIAKNAEMAQKLHDLTSNLADANLSITELKSTMEFLQVEHSFIEADVEKKDASIAELAQEIEILRNSKQDLVSKCKTKLREKTKKLNASRIKLGYTLMEMRGLNSHGSSASSSSE